MSRQGLHFAAQGTAVTGSFYFNTNYIYFLHIFYNSDMSHCTQTVFFDFSVQFEACEDH